MRAAEILRSRMNRRAICEGVKKRVSRNAATSASRILPQSLPLEGSVLSNASLNCVQDDIVLDQFVPSRHSSPI